MKKIFEVLESNDHLYYGYLDKPKGKEVQEWKV